MSYRRLKGRNGVRNDLQLKQPLYREANVNPLFLAKQNAVCKMGIFFFNIQNWDPKTLNVGLDRSVRSIVIAKYNSLYLF